MDCGKKEVTIPNSICKEVEKILATKEEQTVKEFSKQATLKYRVSYIV